MMVWSGAAAAVAMTPARVGAPMLAASGLRPARATPAYAVAPSSPAALLHRPKLCAARLRASVRPFARVVKVFAAEAEAEAGDDFWAAEWTQAEALMRKGSMIEVGVEVANKGGLVVKVNKLRGFIPASQLDQTRWDKDDGSSQLAARLAAMVGETLKVKVIQVDKHSRQLVLSEKAAVVESRLRQLGKGDVRRGLVSSLADFGAFVELLDDDGAKLGVQGLVHVSEISWDRVMHPQEALTEGDQVTVKVINVDTEKSRVGLSIRQMTADPLLQTLDTLIPVSYDAAGETSMAEFPGLDDICATLLSEPGVESVNVGRQAIEDRVVSQDLEIWLTNVSVDDGYNLLVRAGRQVQELHVVTALGRDEIKDIVMRTSNKILMD